MVTVTAASLISNSIYGLLYGAVLGAIASGLTLIWGVMKVVNLSHGHLAVLGAFLAVIFYKYVGYHVDPLLSPILAFVIGIVIGFIFYFTSLHVIVGKAETMTLKVEMSSLMSTFGFGIALYGLLYFASSRGWILQFEGLTGWRLEIGGNTSLTIAGTSIEYSKLYAVLVSIVMIILVELFLRKTVWGLMIRAVAQDARAVALTGYNPVRVKLVTTVLSTAMALAAGAAFALYVSSGINPDLEHILAPLSFVIVVLGGLGSIIGTFIGGLIIGLAYGIAFALTGETAVSLSVSFIILLILLLWKPEGLFGR